ncbi:hypothetical protein ACFTWF_14770 [Rhodococcus sp. NPDC056960]|uniref:hypothetical protein n=1 Tax=Rhodococcus sp. NPDC056960 TaxID=3345982 RepID=UPI00362929B7
MSTVSTRAAQRPRDGYFSRKLRTAAPLERMDPAFARAAEEPAGHPRRAGLFPTSVRAVPVPADTDTPTEHLRTAPQIGVRRETNLEVSAAHHS